MQTSIDVALPFITGATGINAGYARYDIPFPLVTGVPQLTLHGQWIVQGLGVSAPGALSGGLSWPH